MTDDLTPGWTSTSGAVEAHVGRAVRVEDVDPTRLPRER